MQRSLYSKAIKVGGVLLPLVLVCLCPTVVCGQLTQAQLSRLDPVSANSSVLLETVRELLKGGQLTEAIPFLEELVVRLEDDDDDAVRRTRAYSIYQLGECKMRLEDYAGAADALLEYVQEYPEELNALTGRLLLAQCFSMTQDWMEVEEHSRIVLADKGLDRESRAVATQLLGEACFQQERWKDALIPLGVLSRIANSEQVRLNASIMMVTCYARLNDFEMLYRYLPTCDGTVRYDIGLNMAMLESGDVHFQHGEYKKALLLYRQVLGRDELLSHFEGMMKGLLESTKQLVADGDQSLAAQREERRQLQRRYRHMEAQKAILTEFVDYDQDLAMRIAQCYASLNRNWHALCGFQKIYTDYPETDLAQQSRLAALGVMVAEGELELALAEGYAYVDRFPAGTYIDEITLNLLQIQLRRKQLDLAREIGEKGLALSPNHQFGDEVNFLLGYIAFVQMDYDEALVRLDNVMDGWPESDVFEDAEYWRAMATLYLTRFEEALARFEGYLTSNRYLERKFAEDATYRKGVAQYGCEQYVESEQTLRMFVQTYPESALATEAYSMLGDLRGAEGDMEPALAFYGKAVECAEQMRHRNYPTFQSAEIYFKLERYSDVLSLINDYLSRWGRECDFVPACDWIKKSYRAQGNQAEAIAATFKIVEQFGDETELNGVDLVLDGLLEDVRDSEQPDVRTWVMDGLEAGINAAQKNSNETLLWRYKATLAYLLEEGAERLALIDEIMASDSETFSGAITLEFMAAEGIARKEYEQVIRVCDRYVKEFPPSIKWVNIWDAKLDALMALARYDEAMDLANEMVHRFEYHPLAGRAVKRKGDIYRVEKKYIEAFSYYQKVLGVREWRGALTPETLYAMGVCRLEQGEVEEAFAYFQRVYVLYGEYRKWTAPAYLKSAECLKRLGKMDEVRDTYAEMLSDELLAATPEGQEAQKQFDLLGARGGGGP